MSNPEHIKFFREGVNVWNQWRKDNPNITPDLSGERFSFEDLRGRDFRRADLTTAILNGAILRGGYERGADLRDANLTSANLTRADLSSQNLSGVNLTNADLRGARLTQANFTEANITRADFSNADLWGANLTGQTLTEGNIVWARLTNAILINTNLSRLDFSGRDLSGVDLSKAYLQDSNFKAARLINAKLDGANLTGAHLWEIQNAGWLIKNITCEYAYWDELSEEKTRYSLGEFERLHAEQTKIRLFYKDGIKALEFVTLPALIQHLSDAHQGRSLRFVSIQEDGGGAVVELAIEDAGDLSIGQVKQLQIELETTGKQLVEYQQIILAEEKSRLRLEGKIEQLNADFDKLMLRPNIIINNQGGAMGDTYEISGQAGAIGPNAHAHHNTFNQIWNQVKDSTDLPKLAEELAKLRTAMKQEPVEEAAEIERDVAIAEVGKAQLEAKAGNGERMMGHLKSVGKIGYDVATKIGSSVLAELIKKSIEL
jgi:uncharacterized protein YjbI with pentapeptide repeats